MTDREILLVAYGALKSLSLEFREKLDRELLNMVEEHLFPPVPRIELAEVPSDSQ